MSFQDHDYALTANGNLQGKVLLNMSFQDHDYALPANGNLLGKVLLNMKFQDDDYICLACQWKSSRF